MLSQLCILATRDVGVFAQSSVDISSPDGSKGRFRFRWRYQYLFRLKFIRWGLGHRWPVPGVLLTPARVRRLAPLLPAVLLPIIAVQPPVLLRLYRGAFTAAPLSVIAAVLTQYMISMIAVLAQKVCTASPAVMTVRRCAVLPVIVSIEPQLAAVMQPIVP